MFVMQPRLVYTPHLPLEALATADLFVITSLRLWQLARCRPSIRLPDWRAGFEQARIGAQGEAGFDALCSFLAVGVLKPMQVEALHCPLLGCDEAWVLEILGLLQREQTAAARSILAHHCAPTASRLALQSAQALAASLGTRRLWLSLRFTPPHATGRFVAAQCASPLIH